MQRKIALRHGCSPVNLLHIFRRPFPRKASGWLLLHRISGAFGVAHCEESLIPVFQEFFASISKIFNLAGGRALGYHSMGFRHSPDVS